jgi:hypothetical protein
VIREELMSVGEWSLEIDAPPWVLARLTRFDQILVLPSRFTSVSDPDTLRAFASFTGRLDDITHLGGRAELTGPGLAAWLGLDDRGPSMPTTLGGGVWDETTPLDDVLEDLFNPATPGSLTGGIVKGTFNSIPTTANGIYRKPPDPNQIPYKVKDWLDIVADAFNLEYRVNPNLTIDIGTGDDAAMWVQTPEVFVLPGAQRDYRYDVLTGHMEGGPTWWDWTWYVAVWNADWTAGQAVWRPTSVRDAGGTVAASIQQIQQSESLATGAPLIAEAQHLLDFVYNDKQNVTVSLPDCYDPAQHFRVGDYLGVYDLDHRIYDLTHQIHVGGMLAFPSWIRCLGRTWPVRQGMGVYILANDGHEITDVSEYVKFEDGSVELEVGFRVPSIKETIQASRRRR